LKAAADAQIEKERKERVSAEKRAAELTATVAKLQAEIAAEKLKAASGSR